MASVPDDCRISPRCEIDCSFRKTSDLLCIEWNIKNFKRLFKKKSKTGATKLRSPAFQMKDDIWNLDLVYDFKMFRCVVLSRRKWESDIRLSLIFLVLKNDNEICYEASHYSVLFQKNNDVFCAHPVGFLSRKSMTSDNLRVLCIVFPEAQEGASDHITPMSFKYIDVKETPRCEIDDEIRLTEGLLCIEWDVYKSFLQERRLETLSSPTFEMRSASWNLVFRHTETEFLLCLDRSKSESEGRRHFITCLMMIESGKCYPYVIHKSLLNNHLFQGSNSKAHGHSGNSLFLKIYKNSLRIVCIVFPEVKERTSEAAPNNFAISVQKPSNRSHEGIDILVSNIKDLYLKEENCDFVIKVKNRDFHVHKTILAARSPVLSAMLQHDMAEKESGATNIDDCEPDVFERFLLYLYSGHLEELSWSNATHLYRLGDKYEMPHLRKECLQFMEENLSVEAFCDAITLAVKYNESTLVKCAEEFFVENVDDILVTTKWQLLLKENPTACNELFIKYTKNNAAKK